MKFVRVGIVIIVSVVCVGFVLPASYGQVSIINDNLIIGKNKTEAWILGEIVNNSSIPIHNVIVKSSLLNEKEQIIQDKKQSPLIETILPDHKSPFKIQYSLPDSIPDDTIVPADYSLGVEFKPGVDKKQSLDVKSSASKHAQGQMNVSGTIINHGKTTANNVKVISVFYNKEGEVIGIEKTATNPQNIASNKNGSFLVSINNSINQEDQVHSYYVTAESNEFAVIPEFSSAAVIVFVAGTSFILVLTMKRSGIHNKPF